MNRQIIIFLQKQIYLLAHYWYPLFILILAFVWSLAWLAPLSMALGQEGLGNRFYRLLAPHDHQFPQRSYFLFSQAGGVQTYTPAQLIDFGADEANWRAFIGNAEIGYKTALNHRMLAIFTAMFIAAVSWPWLKWRVRAVYLGLFLLPMLIDAASHLLSETSTRFREHNDWALRLTGGLFTENFYAEATLGSLNWLLRTSTGLLFGFGLVCLLLLYLESNFQSIKAQLEPKLKKLGDP